MDISTGKKSHKMQFFYGLLSVVFSPWILAPTRSTSGIYWNWNNEISYEQPHHHD